MLVDIIAGIILDNINRQKYMWLFLITMKNVGNVCFHSLGKLAFSKYKISKLFLSEDKSQCQISRKVN